MDIRRFDLNLLVLFDALYREQNLSAAARALGISQPTASASLRRLRESLSDHLFVSTGRGMRPTPLADSLAAPVADVVATIGHRILQSPVFAPEASDRVFTITTSDIGALIFVPPVLRRLRRLAPRASLRCLDPSHEDIPDALVRGQIDLAIGYFPDLIGSDIITRDLFDHPFTCIVRKDHPKIGDNLSLDQFLAADHLVVSQHGRSQEIFERRVAELELRRRVVLQLPHYMSVPRFVANSDMIAIVPLSLGVWYADHRLKLLQPPVAIPQIELKQHWHRRKDDDPAVAWFRRIVSEELQSRDPSQAMSTGYADMFVDS